MRHRREHGPRFAAVAAAALMVGGCGGDDPAVPVDISTDFAAAPTGWSGSYADFTVGTDPGDAVVEFRQIPAPVGGSCYFLSATNKSDDLFVYVKKRYEGFRPRTRYLLAWQIRFATNAPSGCLGVGGAPGEAVWLVAGAARTEPMTIRSGNEYRINLDKGNQGVGGKDAAVLGHIANSNTDCSMRRYESKTSNSSAPLSVRSGSDGELWLLIGIDSGFEAASAVYLQSMSVRLDPE